VAGRSPWYLAYRRLRSNQVAVVAFGVFVAIVVFVLAAPLWANHVADTSPNRTHTTDTVLVDGERHEVVEPDGTPIGPLWLGGGGRFFLGADGNLGRDEMVRLMYGGRTSLFIGITAALLATLLGVVLALLAAYFRGWIDTAISRTFDVIWAFPVLLLGIALGTALAVGGLKIGPIHISSGSAWIPILIIGIVYTPYIARPLRGELLAMREKEFVEAAVAGGAGPLRIMFGELLPNLWSTIIILFTLNIANAMLLEAGLSFLGAGVQPPGASWGTMISTGYELIYTAPLLTILPGTLIALTVISLNLIGEGLREALDPRSRARLEAHAGSYEPERGAV
jgi:peptide/nickel transport system permease protein